MSLRGAKLRKMFLRTSLTKFPRMVPNIVFRTCTTHRTDAVKTEANGKWLTIYEFPTIKVLGVINKLKNYQSAFTAVGVPICMGLESSQILAAPTTEIFAAIASLQKILLALFT
ncbi:hypothetical protein Bhyg_03396 [Pseudolycoriella hygida]|uniref:Uncharacterized protein n=1 Tax=Pseudolycoriella hygida TaxID=35572 RepID=A0A9Q0NEL2_9DIPT|nr:hypothetical protein Bhyg_03396 [Pseudolycoriella hygida]